MMMELSGWTLKTLKNTLEESKFAPFKKALDMHSKNSQIPTKLFAK
jgi:hypothetical protein